MNVWFAIFVSNIIGAHHLTVTRTSYLDILKKILKNNLQLNMSINSYFQRDGLLWPARSSDESLRLHVMMVKDLVAISMKLCEINDLLTYYT